MAEQDAFFPINTGLFAETYPAFAGARPDLHLTDCTKEAILILLIM